MKDNVVLLYDNPCHSSLEMIIKDDMITLVSEIRAYPDDEDYVTEYHLDKTNSKKLFEVIPFEDFLKYCDTHRGISAVLKLLKDNQIIYK